MFNSLSLSFISFIWIDSNLFKVVFFQISKLYLILIIFSNFYNINHRKRNRNFLSDVFSNKKRKEEIFNNYII